MITPQGDNLIFLLGLPRSGTTLLSVMLNNHPALRCPPEPWLMLALESIGRTSAHDASDAPVLCRAFNEFCDPHAAIEFSRQYAVAAYNRSLTQSHKTILIDKTPKYYLILPYLQKVFPRARFIILLRNPLDVAASMKQAWGFDVPRLLSEQQDHLACIDLIVGLRRLADFRDSADQHTLHTLRYEDLVQNPKTTMDALLDWTAVPHSENMNRFAVRNTEFETSRYGDKKILDTTEPHARSIGNWKTVLSPGDAQLVANHIGIDLIRKLGYGSHQRDGRDPSLYAHRLEQSITLRRSEYARSESYSDLSVQEQDIRRALLNGQYIEQSPQFDLPAFLRETVDMTLRKANTFAAEQSGLKESHQAEQSALRAEITHLKTELQQSRQEADDFKTQAEAHRLSALELSHEKTALLQNLAAGRKITEEVRSLLVMSQESLRDRVHENAQLLARLEEAAQNQADLRQELQTQLAETARISWKLERARRSFTNAIARSSRRATQLESQIANLQDALALERSRSADLQQRIADAHESVGAALARKDLSITALIAATHELDTRLRMLLTSRFMRFGWRLGFGSVPYWDDPARDELTGLVDAIEKQSINPAKRPPPVDLMERALEHLLARGFRPKVILDIGAAKGSWTRRAAARWPDARMFMIDPLQESEESLRKLCADHRFQYILTAAGDHAGEAMMSLTGDYDGSSLLQFPKSDAASQRPVPVMTIDELLLQKRLEAPDCVKIDVQGFEMQVMQGGQRMFDTAEVFILEVNLFRFMLNCPRVHEIVRYMADRDFYLFDIAGMLRRPYQDDLGQMDLVFISHRSPLVSSDRWF